VAFWWLVVVKKEGWAKRGLALFSHFEKSAYPEKAYWVRAGCSPQVMYRSVGNGTW